MASLVIEFRDLLKDDILAYQEQEYAQEVSSTDRGAEKWLIECGLDVKKAVKMFRKSLSYRRENKIDRILDEPFPLVNEFRKSYCHGWHGFDKQGRPLYIERMGTLKIDEIIKIASLDKYVEFHNHNNEFLRKYLLGVASARAQRPIYQVCTIVDLTGLSTSQIGPSAYKFFKAMLDVAQYNYPDTLGHLYIANAPFIFWAFWSMIKPLLAKSISSKVDILKGSNYKAILLENVDEEQLPAFLGGKCECQGGCLMHSELAELYTDCINMGWSKFLEKFQAQK